MLTSIDDLAMRRQLVLCARGIRPAGNHVRLKATVVIVVVVVVNYSFVCLLRCR